MSGKFTRRFRKSSAGDGNKGTDESHGSAGEERRKEQAASATKRYADIYQNVNNVMAVIDEKRQIAELSHGMDPAARKHCERLLGHPLKQFKKVPIEEMITSIVSGAMDRQELQGIDIRLIEQDGSIIDFELSTARLLSKSDIMGIRSTSRQIRELEELEENLTEAVTYLDNIIQNSPDPFLTTDLDGTIFEFNRAAEDLTGYTADEAGKKNISQLIYGGLDIRTFREQVSKEPIHDLETELITKKGIRIPVKISTSELADVKGKPMGIFFIAQEMTSQKVLQDGLLESNARLEHVVQELSEKDNLKSDFIMLLRHEINTPVAVLKSMVSLWKMKDMFTPEQEKKLPSLERQLQRLEDLSERMRDIDQLEMKLTDYIKSEFEGGALLDSVIESLQDNIDEKRHTVVREPLAEVWLEADRIRLEQALIAMVRNAIIYTPDGGTITLSVMQQEGTAVFSIEDNGIGIPREEFRKIFMRFYQVMSIQHHKDGFGLGLALAKRIVEQQGGRIMVESEQGQGSIFSVVMPLRQ